MPSDSIALQTPGLTTGQAVVVEQVTRQITTIEWLAPLAPVALSPFFGIALLSGLACYGPEWLPDNALLGAGSPFSNPAIFWVFLVLTVATSLPRLSKVSKPVAQFADFLETWFAIVVLIALKMITLASPAATESALVIQAGLFEAGVDSLIAIAMVVNIIVINAVKFFFEFLVWITPIPMMDAMFEAANKSVCVLLMGIYAYSPVLALIINIVLFASCLFIFRWAHRREVYFRSVVMDYVLNGFSSKRGTTPPDRLIVFPAYDIGPVPRRSKCLLVKTDQGLSLTKRRWFRSSLVVDLSGKPVIEKNWWTNHVLLPDGTKLTFTSRYNRCLPQLAEKLGGDVRDATHLAGNSKQTRQVEFDGLR